MAGTPGTVRLEARDVSFAYRQPLIRGLSLRLLAGEVLGLVGPNGCGKTTVLKLLDGILKPLAGRVLLGDGRPLAGIGRKEIARQVALVPQNGGLPAGQSVFQFALQGRAPHLSLLGFETVEDERIVREALQCTHLTEYSDAPVGEISGGERQRLLLARALAQQSAVLLLDEFTANLDVGYQAELMSLVLGITRDRRLATLVVSHEINLLAAYCDRIALMAAGSILSEGEPAQVITADNLSRLFGIEFAVRSRNGGAPEVIPLVRKNT